MSKTYYFAVFGDIHGRIALMYTLASLWQADKKIVLDGLLQVGDMGAFPDPNKLDKATFKHAKHDSDELGFSQFCKKTLESQLYFENQNHPKTYFIRGNHEDFDYLSSFSVPTDVDPWNNLQFIPDGQYLNLGHAKDQLYLAGFGGIAPKNSEPHRGKRHRKMYCQEINNAINDPKFFTAKNIQTAFQSTPAIDILMTHAAPHTINTPFGSTLITQLSQRLQPKIHFFGHHHVQLTPCEIANNHLLVGLDHLEFKKSGQLKEGAWGILKIDAHQAIQFSFCTPKKMPWLDKVTHYSYRDLWKSCINY